MKSRMLFLVTQSQHILPISLDVKINMLYLDKEFGMTAYLVKMNK